MKIYEKLELEAKSALKKIQISKVELDLIEKKLEVLAKPSTLQIGTKVRLKEDWSYKDVGWGWRGYTCNMYPENTAIISDIIILDDLSVSYDIKFDKTYYYDDFAKKTVLFNQDYVFNFKPKDLEEVK